MTRNEKLNTGRYALAYPKDGRLQLVANTDLCDLEKLKLLLSDRKANGDAFEGEQVVELWVSLQWFGEHSMGTSFPAYLYPVAMGGVNFPEIDGVTPLYRGIGEDPTGN